MESLAFECYAAQRWGTPGWAEFYVLAEGTLGLMREVEPLVRTLRDQKLVRSHEGIVAALAVLDTDCLRATMRELNRRNNWIAALPSVGARRLREIAVQNAGKRPFAVSRRSRVPPKRGLTVAG